MNYWEKIIDGFSFQSKGGAPDFKNPNDRLLLRMELLKKGWNENAVNELLYRLTEQEVQKVPVSGDNAKTQGGVQRYYFYDKADNVIRARTDQYNQSKRGGNLPYATQDQVDDESIGKEDDESGGKEQDSFEVDEKSEIGTIDNFETELKNSKAKLEKLQVALDKAKETGDEKKIAAAQKKVNNEIIVRDGLAMNQKVLSSLNEGSIDGIVESQTRIENLRDKGLAGAGGLKASQGESRYVNAANTLPPYKEQFGDEEGTKKVKDKKDEIKNRVDGRGKPNYPDKEEKLLLKTLGIDDPNSDEALEYMAKRELFAEQELERQKNDPNSVLNQKTGFDGNEKAYLLWMKTAYDGAVATQEDIKNSSNIDTTKPHSIIQSNDRTDGHDQAIKKHLLDEYKKAKEAGDKDAMEHYKRQYKLMNKLGFHDTMAIGQDKNGRTTLYHISNKKATDISDPHNNTTPAERINVIKKAGFGETIAIRVGQSLERGLRRVNDVKGETTREAVNVPIDENTAAVADRVLKTDGTSYLSDVDDNAKFQKWAQENGVSLESSEDKLKAIQQYIKSEIERTGKPPAYNPFGKIFSKIGEEARKKKFQEANSDIDFGSQGVQDSIVLKETEKESVKSTYQEVVNNITEADKEDGFPDEDGNNGPHTQGYLQTVFDAMHVNTYIENYDEDCSIVVGGRSIKPKHIRECLAEKTDFNGDISTPEGRKKLQEHIRKRCRIDAETGGIMIRSENGEDTALFKDEWRSAGSSTQKVASYYGDEMKKCMAEKVDSDRKSNRIKNGLGK